jgi:hypothetical protein
MPRIVVTTDPLSTPAAGSPVLLLDEHVHSVHLSSDHAAAQLIERLAWAINDAEDAERRHAARPRRPERQPERRRGGASRGRPPVQVHA